MSDLIEKHAVVVDAGISGLAEAKATLGDDMVQSKPVSAEPLFNPLSPDFIRDPYPFYHRLRETEPIHRSPLGFNVATRHADIAFMLRDNRFGRDFERGLVLRYGEAALNEPVFQTMRHWMVMQNPPNHTRLRGLVVKAFNAKRVEEMRPRIQAIVDITLDRIIPDGRMDLIADFAVRLPVTVICEMLGIPEHDHEMFFQSARGSGRLLDPVPLSREEIDAANSYFAGLASYFEDLFELRRRDPADDLTTALVLAEEEGSKLSSEELTANIILLFGAGHDTIVNLIGNGLLALHRNPEQLSILRDNPSLPAIDELLRYDSPVQYTPRTALEPVEVGGTHFDVGQPVLCLLGAANRDPSVYPNPDQLDLTRQNVRPMSFGGGVHFCPGAQLARIEAEIAINTLLRRIPGLTLDDPENVHWLPSFALRGLKTLPAHWEEIGK